MTPVVVANALLSCILCLIILSVVMIIGYYDLYFSSSPEHVIINDFYYMYKCNYRWTGRPAGL